MEIKPQNLKLEGNLTKKTISKEFKGGTETRKQQWLADTRHRYSTAQKNSRRKQDEQRAHNIKQNLGNILQQNNYYRKKVEITEILTKLMRRHIRKQGFVTFLFLYLGLICLILKLYILFLLLK